MGAKVKDKTIVSSAEAAKLLNVSLRTVQLWVEKGILAAWKTPGGHRKISLDSVQQLQRQQVIQPEENDKSTLKLLIVEDLDFQRTLYTKYFEMWNLPLEILMAEDGYQGLLMIGEQEPDILISDLRMPSMNGAEMIRAILSKGDLSEERIIVVTSEKIDSASVVELCGDRIVALQKPISFDLLRQLVEEKISMIKNSAGVPLNA